MKLLTKTLEKQLPKLYAQDGVKDKTIYMKLFCPWGTATWYVAEYDPEEKVFFGYVTGFYEDEWGYASLDELEQIKGPMGLKIERDLCFQPKKFSELNLV